MKLRAVLLEAARLIEAGETDKTCLAVEFAAYQGGTKHVMQITELPAVRRWLELSAHLSGVEIPLQSESQYQWAMSQLGGYFWRIGSERRAHRVKQLREAAERVSPDEEVS